MFLKSGEFSSSAARRITLLGMSGVGKTYLSELLRQSGWFHYSGDYRIGSRYLDEAITDNIKIQAMKVPFLKNLLLSDSIRIESNLSFQNLNPMSSYIGKLGNPELGGLSYEEFKRRLRLFLRAEINAMLDVPEFISKSQKIYGYNHFINDAGGSLCEIEDQRVFKTLAEHTLILYIKANEDYEQELIQRASKAPKPMFYREAFLDEYLQQYLEEKELHYVANIEPDDFVRWIFSKLFYSRIPRYDAIAEQYGYTITTDQLFQVKTTQDFIELVEIAISAREAV